MMLGGMLAGHSESGGEIIEKNGKKYKLFYGMSSDTAMKKHAGGVADYRLASGAWLLEEGYLREVSPLNVIHSFSLPPERRRERPWKFSTKVRWATPYETSWEGSAPPARMSVQPS